MGTEFEGQAMSRASTGPIAAPRRGSGRLRCWVLFVLLIASVIANIAMYQSYKDYFARAEGPTERYHSGSKTSRDKLALVRVSGPILSPLTGQVLRSLKKVRDDDSIKGVLLVVDSPGGLVSDSHQIYHRLRQVSDKKPVVVSMEGMAASGGYYISMGAGPNSRIFAEPTTWTGSIGVIIPHYEVTGLAEKLGVKALPLTTGEFKDALTPFREMTPREKVLWQNIMNQSFEQFLKVIAENRPNLSLAKVRNLATGQVYTADDAKKNGLIDEIGFEEDALAALREATGLAEARVVTYDMGFNLINALLGVRGPDPGASWRALLESTVPRALYFCSWTPIVPSLP